MPKGTLPAWAIAAGKLLIEDRPMHYDDLATFVVKSGLSGLGSDGSTPPQTLRAQMSRDYQSIFVGHGSRSGVYEVVDQRAAAERPEVQQAIWRLMGDELKSYRDLLDRVVLGAVDLSRPEQRDCKLAIEDSERKLKRIARLFSVDLALPTATGV